MKNIFIIAKLLYTLYKNKKCW